MKKMSMRFKIGLLSVLSLVLSACALPGLGAGGIDEEGIIVAAPANTEPIIVTYIVQGMIEHYIDTEVTVIQNLGSTFMVSLAIDQGDANVGGLAYTGTSLTGELGMYPITDPEEARRVVTEEFENQMDVKYYPSYGFENTYAFLVSQDFADEHGLETVSDLEAIANDVTAGVDTTWMERAGDGYNAFVEHYDFDFGTIYPMQIGLVYDALAAGDMDVVLGYSTDGRIASYDLTVLEDDLNFFPPYDGSPIAAYSVLEEYEELDDILLKLEGTIDTDTMQELNFISDDYLIEPAIVAQRFLEENNYFEDKEPYLEPVEGGQ